MTQEGETRRGAILGVAAELFARNGYSNTGVDDIGSALGISGPAIYRHFANKQEIIDSICVDGSRYLYQEALHITATEYGLDKMLRELVRMRVEFAFGPHRFAFIISRRERSQLSAQALQALDELNGLYWSEWLRVLSLQFPSRSTVDLRAAWLGAHILIGHAATREMTLSTDEFKPLLERMALAVIKA